MPFRNGEFVDVRMRGFERRTDVDELLRLVDERLALLDVEAVEIRKAGGRTLATSVRSTVDVPAFHRSAMDGYAVRSAATPGEFLVVGEVFPGRPRREAVAAGQTVAIMTGAPLPAGVDSVVPVERVEVRGDRVIAREAIAPGKNVGRRGEDVTAGEQILAAGRVLLPQDLGLLAAVGVGHVTAVRRPKVALFATGNELLPAGSRPDEYRIVDSNSIMLTARKSVRRRCSPTIAN